MLELNKKVLKEIVNALVHKDPESLEQYRISINNEYGEGVENSKYTQQWDNRYNTIIKIAKKHGLQFAKIKRGNLWEAVFVIGSNNEIYVFFSQKNLRSIIRKGKKNHYLKLLNLFNEALDNMPPLEEEITLFDFKEDDSSKETLEIQALEVVQMMTALPSKVSVIAFDNAFKSSAEILIFNSKQQIIWREDLTYLIESDYKLVLAPDDIETVKKEKYNSTIVRKQIVRLKNK